MGVLGGLGGILWVLPAGTAMLAGHGGHRGTEALLRAPVPFSLSVVSTETAPMSFRDRFGIARGRSDLMGLDWGGFSITASAGRAHGGRPSLRRADRLNLLTTYQLGAAIRTALPGGFTLGGGGTVTYINRRLGLAGFDGRSRHSLIADAELSIAHGPNDRLSISYVDVAPGSDRATIMRRVELAAGAPRAASGFRLAVSHRLSSAGPRSLVWGLDLSAMRLSERDSLLLGERFQATDRRVAMELDRRF